MSAPRHVMVGGFLGAGKTTAIGRLARHLTDRGLRVGLVTNDQSSGLVDSRVLRGQGWDVEEIAGGCFCCRFTSLEEAMARLTAATRPDVFLAEPVGSCTDLVATVSYPLRRIYGAEVRVAPLTVLVDPLRAERVLGWTAEGRSFSPKVRYVYEKQLEEARIVLVNKVDLIDDGRRERLVARLGERFPRADVLCVGARDGVGMEAWYERLLAGDSDLGPTLDIDYDLYAAGEAELGWLNATAQVRSGAPFDANTFLGDVASSVAATLGEQDVEIAHLKLTLDSGSTTGALAAISVVGSERDVDVRESLLDRVDTGELVINLRAEGAPDALRSAVRRALETHAGDLRVSVEHWEDFRPAAPVPVHREEVAG